jgi:hypothetical protein
MQVLASEITFTEIKSQASAYFYGVPLTFKQIAFDTWQIYKHNKIINGFEIKCTNGRYLFGEV